MALTDPQSVTVNAVAQSMPRVEVGTKKAAYITNDENFRLDVSHSDSGNRVRSLVKVTQRKVVTDPLSSENDYDTSSLQIVLDRPKVGFSLAELEHLRTGVLAWYTTAKFAQLFGQES